MTLGSVAGTVVGGLLLGIVPDVVLVPGLTLLLLLSAIKVCRHRNAPGPVPDGMVPILEPEDPAGGSV